MIIFSRNLEIVCTKFWPYGIILTIAVLAVISEIGAFAAQPADDPFPLYPSIEPNVAFWKKVYGEYSTTQGIIHDRRNPGIVYEIIILKDRQKPGARKFNDKKVAQVKKRYEQLLKKMAAFNAPRTSEEKRIRALFVHIDAQELLKDAHRNIRFQLGQKDRFCDGVIRSAAYIEEIRKIFKSYDLPEDLAYLPHVESSFDYRAYSKFGAAGIWQFTHGTGRRFMTIDYTVDERRDPIRSTHAAARFLRENYEALGNWPMAITAYNHGTRGMLKAQKSKGDYETIFNGYEGRTFGFASRNFYSEFLAAREVARDYRAHFGDLEIAEPISYQSFPVPGYIAFEDLVRHFRLDTNTLKELNPALRAPVFKGQKYVPKGYHLNLPEKTAFEPESLWAKIPAHLIKARQKPSRFYCVQRGDTAGKIAGQHDVRLSDLILANQLDSRATIYAGQNLRIPVQGEKIILASRSNVPVMTEKSTPAVTPVDPATDDVRTVSPEGESPVKEPQPAEMAERATGSGPVVETESVVPLPDKPLENIQAFQGVNPAVVTCNLSVEKVFTSKGKLIGIIQVEPEETLGHYADWLQIPTQQIRRVNGFSYGKQIHVSQKIKIPFEKISKEQFEEKRYEYHKEIEEDFFAVYGVEKIVTYVIERGDNPWTLCQKKFEQPFWILKKYNPETDFNRLIPLDKLAIPVVVKIGENSEPAASDSEAMKSG